jgi:hypothetical protein
MHTSQLKTLNHKYADDELVSVFVMDNFEDDDDNQNEKTITAPISFKAFVCNDGHEDCIRSKQLVGYERYFNAYSL